MTARPALRTDQALVDALREGDERAFEQLVERHRGPLVRHATRLLGDVAAAEDVVQESLWRAWRALRADDRQVALRPWLHRVVRNGCLDQLRLARPVAGGEVLAGLEVEGRADPHLALLRRDELHAVVADVAALPPRQRRAVVANAFDGRSHAEVAAGLGITPRASKSLLNRARVSLHTARAARTAA